MRYSDISKGSELLPNGFYLSEMQSSQVDHYTQGSVAPPFEHVKEVLEEPLDESKDQNNYLTSNHFTLQAQKL